MAEGKTKSAVIRFLVVFLVLIVAWIVLFQLQSSPRYIPPPDSTRLFQAFHRHFVDSTGGVYTNLRNDLPLSPGMAANHQMLSESTGLLMLYALKTDDRALFDLQYRFLNQYLLAPNGLVRWIADPADSSFQAHANASIDDLRIVSALDQAERKWGTDGKSLYGKTSARIASALLEYQTGSGGLLADYFDWHSNRQAETVTVSYLDLQTMERLALRDSRWKPVADSSRALLQNAALPNGLFRKTYRINTNDWEPLKEVHLVDTLYSAYHLAQAGADVAPTADFISGQFARHGKLYGIYNPDGSPAKDVESPAVYALAIRLLDLANSRRPTAELLRKRLDDMAVSDPASPYFGAYVQLPGPEGYSFDHLQALLAEQ